MTDVRDVLVVTVLHVLLKDASEKQQKKQTQHKKMRECEEI